MSALDTGTWTSDWVWSLPLMLMNVIVHVFGLAFINDAVVYWLRDSTGQRHFMLRFARVMTAATLLIIVLHAIEAVMWAVAYQWLGALPDQRTAMLYSLGAMTSYGHANLFLSPQWQMMGVLQSLTGVLLFGLTTAFLFAMVQTVWKPRGWIPR